MDLYDALFGEQSSMERRMLHNNFGFYTCTAIIAAGDRGTFREPLLLDVCLLQRRTC